MKREGPVFEPIVGRAVVGDRDHRPRLELNAERLFRHQKTALGAEDCRDGVETHVLCLWYFGYGAERTEKFDPEALRSMPSR
jgi:hypothetical protein